jgi:hypothetical protein
MKTVRKGFAPEVRMLAFGQPDRRSVKADRLTLEISTEKKQLSLLKTFLIMLGQSPA